MPRKRLLTASIAAAALAAVALATSSCRSSFPRRDPTSEIFPAVSGTSLSGESVSLPDAFRGRPVVFLVGYRQDSQFDIDRWLLGLSQSGAKVDVREIPTIPGMAPRMFSSFIDSGMRRGIPQEDWGSVVTVYADGAAIAQFTGNDDGLPGRVLLLDGEGRVVFFHDRGYSTGSLERLLSAAQGLDGRAIAPAPTPR